MRVYLDNCCLNRPYDDQSQIGISLEAQAKLHVQDMIRKGELSLVSSYILRYEVAQNPFESKRAQIEGFLQRYSALYVHSGEPHLLEYAQEAMGSGIKPKDALHVACARAAGCDYLLTTDKRLLKYECPDVELANPVDFAIGLEA